MTQTVSSAVTNVQNTSVTQEIPLHLNVNHLELEKINIVDQFLKIIFFNPLLNYIFGKKLVNFFRKVSDSSILSDLEVGPGSWKSMLSHYGSTKPKSILENLMNRYMSFSAALRNRQKLVVTVLSQLIESYGKVGPVNIVGVGSGCGNNTLTAIELTKDKAPSVKAQMFDLNESALDFGRQKALEMKLDSQVSFINADANKLEGKIADAPQIVEMIGLVEYLSDANVKQLFSSVSKFRNPSGAILISSMENKHGVDRFLKNTLDFHLIYRSPKKLMGFLSECGYKKFNVFPEPTGLFNVIVGQA